MTSWIDIVLLVLFVSACFRGYRRGLLLELTSLAGAFLGLWVAYHFSASLVPLLQKNVPLPTQWTSGFYGLLPISTVVYKIMAFLVLFLAVKFGFYLLSSFINQLARLPILKQINAWAGLLFGLVQYIILLLIVVNLLHILPWSQGQQWVSQSALAQGVLSFTPDFTQQFKSIITGHNLATEPWWMLI